jgi:hypothetical protein
MEVGGIRDQQGAAATRRGAVIYRSKLHATLKRNFQVMPGVKWLELLCKHVPDRHEHMVRRWLIHKIRYGAT